MKDNSTKKDTDDYELRPEYDLSQMTVLPRGRYAAGRRSGRNVIVLDPEIADAFPDDDAVNQALRLVLQMTKIPHTHDASTETP